MATENKPHLAEMPICACGQPLREKGMVRRLTRSGSFRAGPRIGWECSSISSANIICHSCKRDNIVEYLWIDKWERGSGYAPQIGYQLRPGDDPVQLLGQLLELRANNALAVAPPVRPAPPEMRPMDAQQASLARAWIEKIREECGG